jgi:hypothetical protein
MMESNLGMSELQQMLSVTGGRSQVSLCMQMAFSRSGGTVAHRAKLRWDAWVLSLHCPFLSAASMMHLLRCR